MIEDQKQKVVLVTGAAGFIGFHISNILLKEGWRVVGVDCMSDYYDVRLKEKRESILLKEQNYRSVHEKIESPDVMMQLFCEEQPDFVIHLAAQAGVRHSIDNPRSYIESNINGTFELLEAARTYPPQHMLLASTSSVYGANKDMPYKETDKVDQQMSLYAASKKSTENIAHSYAHLFNLPMTMFRFFTVYGPWGRPDMAIFKFTRAILNGDVIDVYNQGEMSRDFTYIDDLVTSVRLLMSSIPQQAKENSDLSCSAGNHFSVAPFRIVNIGNSKPEKLLKFITAIEQSTGMRAVKNLMPLQAGDVPATWADTEKLKHLTGYVPQTEMSVGVENFVRWYRDYYKV
jgi:UDP-glucuronate 4-epimerase